MADIHHHYGEGSNVSVNHFHDSDADAALSDVQAAGLTAPASATVKADIVQAAGLTAPASATVGAPDNDTKEADIVQAASVIAAAFISRNYDKHGDRGQYSLDTIVRMSVATAEKIHAAVHDTE